MQPLVSVIVPCYNYGLFLPQTLDSVLNQTYPHWECLIVDDGSADNTREVAMAYAGRDSRFRYMYQANAGVSAARNNGIAHSRGEYIQLLDADDLLEPEKFTAQVAAFRQHAACDVVYSYARLCPVHADGSFIYAADGSIQASSVFNRQFSVNGEKLLGEFIICCPFPVDMPLIRKRVFENIGFFDTSLDAAEDWDFWVKCAYGNFNFHYQHHENAGVVIRVHNLIKNVNRRDFEGYLVVRDKIAGLVLPKPLKRLNTKWRYWFCITHYRRIRKRHLSWLYVFGYLLFAAPREWTELKIFLGDILFPGAHKTYLRLKSRRVAGAG